MQGGDGKRDGTFWVTLIITITRKEGNIASEREGEGALSYTAFHCLFLSHFHTGERVEVQGYERHEQEGDPRQGMKRKFVRKN